MNAQIKTMSRKMTGAIRGVVEFDDGKEFYFCIRAGLVEFETERATTFGSVRVRVPRGEKYFIRTDALRAALARANARSS